MTSFLVLYVFFNLKKITIKTQKYILTPDNNFYKTTF